MKYSLMDYYSFPELMWAEPSTQQVDPEVKEGEPKIHLFQTPDKSMTLEVDAQTGFPLRFKKYGERWTYSYKADATPIVIPEKLRPYLLRVLPQKDQ